MWRKLWRLWSFERVYMRKWFHLHTVVTHFNNVFGKLFNITLSHTSDGDGENRILRICKVHENERMLEDISKNIPIDPITEDLSLNTPNIKNTVDLTENNSFQITEERENKYMLKEFSQGLKHKKKILLKLIYLVAYQLKV